MMYQEIIKQIQALKCRMNDLENCCSGEPVNGTEKIDTLTFGLGGNLIKDTQINVGKFILDIDQNGQFSILSSDDPHKYGNSTLATTLAGVGFVNKKNTANPHFGMIGILDRTNLGGTGRELYVVGEMDLDNSIGDQVSLTIVPIDKSIDLIIDDNTDNTSVLKLRENSQTLSLKALKVGVDDREAAILSLLTGGLHVSTEYKIEDASKDFNGSFKWDSNPQTLVFTTSNPTAGWENRLEQNITAQTFTYSNNSVSTLTLGDSSIVLSFNPPGVDSILSLSENKASLLVDATIGINIDDGVERVRMQFDGTDYFGVEKTNTAVNYIASNLGTRAYANAAAALADVDLVSGSLYLIDNGGSDFDVKWKP